MKNLNMPKSIYYLIALTTIIIPSLAFSSEPKPWQMDLQKPSGIIAESATDLHNFLLIVITLISLFVLVYLFMYAGDIEKRLIKILENIT